MVCLKNVEVEVDGTHPVKEDRFWVGSGPLVPYESESEGRIPQDSLHSAARLLRLG